MHPTCWKYLWTILTATTTFQLPVFASGWARRPSQGKSYGRKYIEPFKNDIDDMFMSGIEDKSNKTGPGRMLEQLRLKYSDRLDLPSESEIRQRISSLFAKYKKHGTIEAKRRGIIEFYRQHLGIIKKVMTKARENMWLVSFYPTSRISNSTWTVACFQTYALPLVIVIISDSLDEINELFLKTEKLIVRYVRDVSAMLCFVSAVREKRIERHLAAERVLLPKCFAFGHQNYARYMTFQHVKLQDIKSKQDEAWNDLLVNGFGGSVSGKPYSTIHGDLITETTINREVKVRGGPMQGGFSTDEKAVDTFVKTSHFMATVRVKLKERLNVLTQSVHKETTVGAIKRHKTMIESLVLQLDKYFNPFLEGPARHFKTGAEIEQSFDVHIVHDSNYGMKLNNGSWNGMIGELIDEKADIALGPISMTTERLKVVDFSPAIIHSGLSIVYQKPKLLTFNIQSYFAPFSLNFWYLMTASVLVCWICLHFLRLSCNDVECKVEYHARRNIFTIFAMITMQGIHFEPSKSAIRGVLWVLWIWCIIINVAYTANIFSVLAMSRKSVPFKSLYEFSNQDEYKPLVMKNSAHDAFFRNSSIPWHKKIWKKILERGQESFVNNPEEGRIKLNEEKVAYIGDYLSILMNIDRADIGYLKEIQAEDSPCLAFRKNFMYSSLISNRALSRSELEVSLHEVEACLNSRPLTFVSDEVDAHVPLIPFHFLIGKSTNLQQSEDHQPIEYEMSQIGNQKSKAANSLEILSFLLENIYSNRAVIIYDRFMDMEITKKVMQIMKKNMWLVSFYPTSKNQSKISIHFPLIRKKPNMEVTFLKLKNGVDLNQYQSVLKDVKLRKEIKSEIIKVVTIHDPTYVIIDSKIPIRISGIYADILDCLKQDLETNFDLHIVHDSNYGVKLRNGSWNGMIGELIDEKADIALGPLSMTAERLDVVDFSPEILQSGLSIVYQKPIILNFNIQSYLAPFSINFWYMVTASVLVYWACLHFFRLSCNEVECKAEYHARRNLFTIFAMITMQGQDYGPSKSAIRGVLWILWIWCIIINVAYTANIFSVLARQSKSVPFKSLREFSNQDEYKPLILENSAMISFFQNSSVPWNKKIWKKILDGGQESFVNTTSEGRMKLSEKKVGYISDYLHILMNIDEPDIGYLKEKQAKDSLHLVYRKKFMYSSIISNRTGDLDGRPLLSSGPVQADNDDDDDPPPDKILPKEAGVFGPTVIENSILNGRHYSRCLEGMQLLAEAFQRLLYKEFFAEKNVKPYAQELQIVANLKTAVMKRNVIASQKYLVEFADASSKLVEDLNSFIETQSSVNENFKFWAQFLHMMSIVHNLLRADREGLWEHLDAVQRALYLFAAFDSTNYLQWCFLYLEDMRRLPQIAPSVHENFVRNNFSIKDKPGRFTAVGDDQKLEQSINLLSKCSDGIIGHTKQKQYVAQWDLIYHEMMAVKNLHRQYADVIERSHETFNHHESSQVKTDRKEARVQEMMRFIQEKGSFLSPNTPENLHNFVTKEIMSKDISNDMLNALKRNGRST
ncbi:putative glutamate receptor [Nymphon striatum]|nr:putative glutamate receptor [Nymphon striatum]